MDINLTLQDQASGQIQDIVLIDPSNINVYGAGQMLTNESR